MTRRRPLPEPFDSRPFRVRDALVAGIARDRLDARDLVRVHHGVRSRPPSDLVGRCAALVPLMSETQAFTGPTAARLADLPLPLRIERDERLHVSSLRPQRAMRRPDVVASGRGRGAVQHVDGLPVLDPALVWIALGRTLDVADLVAVGDRLVSGTAKSDPVSTPARLEAAIRFSRGVPGMALARTALPHVRVGAWSRPETLLRMLLLDAGIPEPVLNVAVELPGGRVAIPDLAWPEFGVLIDYDGWWHEAQAAVDADRHERLTDAGWLVVHVRRFDLFHQPGVIVRRVVDRLTQRGYRHPSPIDVARTRRFVA